ncbi:MAG: Hpt domain-containing protein, partial [Burkholderiales bacterium]|nr:Hpt domain-containing protein [Burkholderiales bacterium]
PICPLHRPRRRRRARSRRTARATSGLQRSTQASNHCTERPPAARRACESAPQTLDAGRSVTYVGPAFGGAPYHRRVDSVPLPSPLPAPAAEAAAPAVLDAAALQRLQALDPRGENQVVERVLRAFEGSLERLLDQAAAAQRQGDSDSVRHVAHTLKSSSASVGALRLSQHCSEVEHRLRQEQDPGIDASLAGLQHEGRRVLVAVRRLLGTSAR